MAVRQKDGWREDLHRRFDGRATFSRKERLLASHDQAALPSIASLFLKEAVPEAVVRPTSKDDLVYLVDLARRWRIPLIPRGAATSGYGGARPVRKGIVVDFSGFNRVLAVDPENLTVKVEPGVVWQDLTAALAERDLGLLAYPSSAPGSTVGGWVAQDGAGIGSYSAGFAAGTVLSVEVVLPDGTTRELHGRELALVTGLEGITGLIASVTLRLRRGAAEYPVAAAFKDLRGIEAFADLARQRNVPLWHLSFLTPNLVELRARAERDAESLGHRYYHYSEGNGPSDLPAGKVIAIAALTSKEAGETLKAALREAGGEVLPDSVADLEWAERFYPMRQKRLGPSIAPSESIVPAHAVSDVVGAGEKRFPGLTTEGTFVGPDRVVLLQFLTSDERSLHYNVDWLKSLALMDTARARGGRAYASGLYLIDRAEECFGRERLEEIRAWKKENDPDGIMNPEKIVPLRGTGMRTALKAAAAFKPLLPLADAVAPRGVPRNGKIPEAIAREAIDCAQCGYCRNVCTLYSGRQWESASPRGKWELLRRFERGELEIDKETAQTFLLCTTCKRCDTVCQVKSPIQGMWDQLRGDFVHYRGLPTFPAFHMMAASYRLERNIWAGRRADRAAWVPEDIKYADSGEVAYWGGCTASYLEDDIAINALRILKEGGVDFAYMGTGEGCCGIPFLVSGKWDVWEEAVRFNVAEIRKRGIKTLIVSCPGCWVSLEHYYRQWAPRFGLKWDVKIRHISEVAADLVREGRLVFTNPLPEGTRAAWHDPCHIGRHGGIYEAPREVLRAIPGLELVEMEHNRENGLCCGSVLTRVGEPETSDKIAAQRVGEAEKAGAGTILTTCPCCEFQLRVGGRSAGSEVRVLDFTDFVVNALGYESTDPTERVHYMWGVFRRAIEMMELDGVVRMMETLMPGMFEHMPGFMKGAMAFMKLLPKPLRRAGLAAMGPLLPAMMPPLMNMMLPKMLPDVAAYMLDNIPDMPESMRELLPAMLPGVMADLMPDVMKDMIPLVKPGMMKAMESHLGLVN